MIDKSLYLPLSISLILFSGSMLGDYTITSGQSQDDLNTQIGDKFSSNLDTNSSSARLSINNTKDLSRTY